MADERIVQSYVALLKAWNRRDADAFAAAFAANGSAVGFDGSTMNGRDEIASALREIFTDHPTASYVAKVREVRAVGPGVVLLRAVAGMIPPGKTAVNPATNAIQSVVFTIAGDEATIALLHNTPAAFHGRPHLADALTGELTEVMRRGVVVAAG